MYFYYDLLNKVNIKKSLLRLVYWQNEEFHQLQLPIIFFRRLFMKILDLLKSGVVTWQLHLTYQYQEYPKNLFSG
jgi:hypothetical protein